LRLKEWVDRAVSLMLSGSAFQTIGPATEKASGRTACDGDVEHDELVAASRK